jgi:hypothetical protein
MIAASIKQLQSQLEQLDQKELTTICIRLAKYKKDNKELLSYMLFEASDETDYIRQVSNMIDELFATVNLQQLYFAKKSLRKIIRITNKHVNFSDEINTGIMLWIRVYNNLIETGIDFSQSKVIDNMKISVKKKIDKLINGLHEDLQYDYRKMLQSLSK